MVINCFIGFLKRQGHMVTAVCKQKLTYYCLSHYYSGAWVQHLDTSYATETQASWHELRTWSRCKSPRPCHRYGTSTSIWYNCAKLNLQLKISCKLQQKRNLYRWNNRNKTNVEHPLEIMVWCCAANYPQCVSMIGLRKRPHHMYKMVFTI
jgi:hypothetical protein